MIEVQLSAKSQAALLEEQKLQFVVYIICGHTIFSGINVIR